MRKVFYADHHHVSAGGQRQCPSRGFLQSDDQLTAYADARNARGADPQTPGRGRRSAQRRSCRLRLLGFRDRGRLEHRDSSASPGHRRHHRFRKRSPYSSDGNQHGGIDFRSGCCGKQELRLRTCRIRSRRDHSGIPDPVQHQYPQPSR